MTHMSPPSIAEPGGEALFAPHELFYSRTDPRGVIRTGNSVFQRVSGHDWSGLVGAPHRIVRHPDMPRAVFHLMWQALRQGETVVTYVKNRTVSGGFYWVLAVVLPVADGYLSIRIKPGTALLGQVMQLYARIRERELADHLPPESSTKLLVDGLRGMGFADYAQFMRRALVEELALRNQTHPTMNPAIFADIARTEEALSQLDAEQDRLVRDFDRLRDLPTNMRIIASRLEPSGGPVSAISDTYKVTLASLSADIRAIALGEGSLLTQMQASFARAVLLLFTARLQGEVVAQFRDAASLDLPFDVSAENALLSGQARACEGEARNALSRAVQIATALKGGCSDIRRSMLGLDTIRVMGRVESGRMGVAGAGLAATIDQLDVRHATIIERLLAIMDLAATINSGIGRIVSRQAAVRRAGDAAA